MRNYFKGLPRMASLVAVVVYLSLLPTQASAGVLASIDLSSQTMNVYVNGIHYHSWKVSTARRGYRTPTGNYRPTRMHRMWRSRKYNMSPMPYSIFYRGGYAIHGTYDIKRLGRRASHGCVRLHPSNARRLYRLVRQYGPKNTRIRIRY